MKATAYHEAGHAFAIWHFGFKVKKATIVPKDDAAGYVVSKTGLHLRSLEYTNPSGAPQRARLQIPCGLRKPNQLNHASCVTPTLSTKSMQGQSYDVNAAALNIGFPDWMN
jgi:hypothetical protein